MTIDKKGRKVNLQKKITTASALILFLVMAATAGASLLGRWTMDDNATSANVADSSGYSRTGTFYSGRGVEQNTSVGHSEDRHEGTGSLIFDGSNDFVEITGYNGILGGNSRTCAAWVKSTPGSTFDIISWGRWNIGIQDAANGKIWVFRVNSNGTIAVGVWGGNIRTSTTVNDGNWHHVAAVLNNDGSPILNEIKLYIDGVQQSTIASSTTVVINSSNNTTDGSGYVIIGANSDLGSLQSECFKGQIDDVRIYNTALSTAEIAAMNTWNPSPRDGATNVILTSDLSWSGQSGALSYNVYFGTTNPPAYFTNTTSPTANLSTLSFNTNYYWRIDVVKSTGTTVGTVRSFTTLADGTLPAAAANPIPGDTATNISVTTDYSWDAANDATSYQVYRGTSLPLSGTPTTVKVPFLAGGTLATDTTYYWRVDTVNASGTTTGANWSFTTESVPPATASNLSPANQENYVSPYSNLSWTAGSQASSHNVYFGTDLDLVTNSVPLAGDINGNRQVDISDLAILCNQWLGDGSASPSADIVVNNNVDLEDFAAVAATWGQTTAFKGNQTSTTFAPELVENETYYWRVDEVNRNGTTTGTVHSFTTEARLTPEQFVIMPWDGPAGRDYTASVCNGIRDCGFNLTGITFVDPYNSSPADLTNFDNAAAAGLKSLAYHYNTAPMTTDMANWSPSQINYYVDLMVSAVSDHPALFGYHLRDEPPSTDWLGLGNWVTSLKTYDPDKLVYMNLGWDYDFAGFVADTGQSDHLSYDYYGMQNDNAVGGYYFPCLENARSAATSTGIPFWNTVSSIRMLGSYVDNNDERVDYPYWDVAAPTPANLRFQLYTSLAYGAQGISWFTYFDVITTPAAPIMWGTNGSKRIFWYYLQDVNMQMHRIGQTYINLTYQNVFHYPNVPSTQQLHGVNYSSRGISTSNYVQSISGGDFCVGEFYDPSGHPYIMLVNKSLTSTSNFNVTFKTAGTMYRVNSDTGQLETLEAGERYLAPGEGMLISVQ